MLKKRFTCECGAKLIRYVGNQMAVCDCGKRVTDGETLSVFKTVCTIRKCRKVDLVVVGEEVQPCSRCGSPVRFATEEELNVSKKIRKPRTKKTCHVCKTKVVTLRFQGEDICEICLVADDHEDDKLLNIDNYFEMYGQIS